MFLNTLKLRKLLLLSVLLLAVAALSIPVMAQEPGNVLDSMERHFPEDTVFYGVLRLDADYISTIDDVLTSVLDSFEAGTADMENPPSIPDITLTGVLDMLSLDTVGEDFQTAFGDWLGDYGAYGIFDVEGEDFAGDFNDLPQAIVVTVRDRAGADDYLNDVLADDYEINQIGDFTVYTRRPNDPVLLLNDDVMYFTNEAGFNSLDELLAESSLADSEAFNETIELLPEDSYNALLYFDLGDVLELFADSGMFNPGDEVLLQSLIGATGQQAVGLTILDNRSLTVDVVQNSSDLEEVAGVGLPTGSTGPVDLDFLQFVPANANVVLHGTNLRFSYEALIQQTRAQAELQGVDPDDAEQIYTDLEEGLEAVLGLDFDEDIIGWLDGDYALFASYAQPEPGELTFFNSAFYYDQVAPIDFDLGLVIEATDPEKAANFAAAVGDLLDLFVGFDTGSNLSSSRETIGGVEATVLSIPVLHPLTDFYPDFPPMSEPLELVVAANEDVFVFATRRAAESILNGESGFNTTDGFAEASAYVLDDTTQFWYMDGAGLSLLGEGLVGLLIPSIGIVLPEQCFGDPETEACQQQLAEQKFDLVRYFEESLTVYTDVQRVSRAAGATLTSSSISAMVTDDGDTVIRFVLTLPE